MILKTPLELSVYWLTPAAVEAEKLGLECDDDSELRRITFYSIDHIGEYTELVNNKPSARVFSSGADYLTDLSYEALKRLILEHV